MERQKIAIDFFDSIEVYRPPHATCDDNRVVDCGTCRGHWSCLWIVVDSFWSKTLNPCEIGSYKLNRIGSKSWRTYTQKTLESERWPSSWSMRSTVQRSSWNWVLLRPLGKKGIAYAHKKKEINLRSSWVTKIWRDDVILHCLGSTQEATQESSMPARIPLWRSHVCTNMLVQGCFLGVWWSQRNLGFVVSLKSGVAVLHNCLPSVNNAGGEYD